MLWLSPTRLCQLAALIFAALCVTLLFIPGLFFWLFQMENDAGGAILAARAAMLFAGFSYLTWSARALTPSPARRAIFRSVAVAMAGLALVGVLAFVRGEVGGGIALAIVTEVFFVAQFLWLSRQGI
ncbi:hypothetical protein [Planktotalea sp.]|uniref:hypothetical protein n=1 Tax=Planktotalea sp. TaxID=2029877 RepID=UPI003F6AF3A0